MIPPPEHDEQRVAIITGASQGIGAGLVKAYRERGYAVIGTARSIGPSEDPAIVTIGGDIADPDTAQRVVEETVERFGRIDTLINNAGIYIGKPFTTPSTVAQADSRANAQPGGGIRPSLLTPIISC